MNAKWSFDPREFSRAATDLMAAQRKSGAEIIKQQGRLFVRDVVRATPPFGSHAFSQGSSNVGRRIGEAAVSRDISKVFVTPSRLRVLSQPQNPKLYERLKKVIRSGDTAAVEAIFRNLNIHVKGVLLAASRDVHKRSLNKRGHYMRGNSYFVLRENSVKQYIRQEQSHVGRAKAGWARAAAGLGEKLPNWITRHSEPGLFIDDTANGDKPSVTIGNLVDYAQQFEGQLNIVQAALQNRVRSMRTQTEKILEHNLRRHAAK